MKKISKCTLSILLAAIIICSAFLPFGAETFLSPFSVEASAASITSTVSAHFVIFLPSGAKMYSCSSATGATNSTPYFSGEKTIYAKEKVVLSNGNVRFLITANTASGERTLYYQLPSSATAYQLPESPQTITYSGKMCRDDYVTVEWNTTSYADLYTVELYEYNGSFLKSYDAYPLSNGKTSVNFYLGDRAPNGGQIGENFNVVIRPKRIINSKEYFWGSTTYSDVWFFSCGIGCSHGIYGINYDANGGYGGPQTQKWSNSCSGYTTLTNSVPSRDGYTFLGWATSSTATQPTYYPGSSVYFDHNQLFLYAVWSKIPTYTVSYNANGGTGAPSAQTKTKDTTLWLSSTKPTKSFTVTYNANGGSVSPTSKTVNCTFRNWNTSQNGSGTTYAPGSSYTVNSGALLYAQWSNPTYGTLPTPTKAGYTFDGWYTSASGGTKVTSSTTVASNTTLYAHWSKIPEADIYNLGEETYSFANFGDRDSSGHCFGMSVTSAGYYTEELDITDVGGNYEQDVYALKRSARVDAPICYYQKIQKDYSKNAIVAGGTNYKDKSKWDIASDWNEVINYVKNHSHDNKGDLQIGFRGKYDYYGTAKEGGHAINFLRYEEVNGQPRIYAYDNNFPDTETYFYKDSNGNIKQAPKATFDISIDCIALRSIPKYFDLAADYDSTRYIYAEKDSISIEGLDAYLMDGSTEMGSTVMFEVPAGINQITIVPLVDNAEFEYLDESYSFGAVDDDTVGVFTLATSDDQGSGSSPSFTIENEGKSIWELIVDFFKMIFGFILLPFALLF